MFGPASLWRQRFTSRKRPWNSSASALSGNNARLHLPGGARPPSLRGDRCRGAGGEMTQCRTGSAPGRGMDSCQALAAVLVGSLVIAVGCNSAVQQPAAIPTAGAPTTIEPLGWGGPVEAREVRGWTAESIEAAQVWTLAETPVRVLTPDTLQPRDGRSGQRRVRSGVIFPGGHLALAASVPSDSTQVVAVESPLVRPRPARGAVKTCHRPPAPKFSPEGGRKAEGCFWLAKRQLSSASRRTWGHP